MKTHTFKSTKGGEFSITVPNKYNKIKLPLFKKWVDALESGRFRQCTGILCEVNKNRRTYCCLGVLSKLQGRLAKTTTNEFEDGSGTSETAELHARNPLYAVLGSTGILPKNIEVNAGNSTAYSLVGCNDELNLSFKDIAKIIRVVYCA